MSFLIYGAMVAAASAQTGAVAASRWLATSTTVVAQLRVQRTTIIRVPPISPTIIQTEPTRWKEKGGPDCIKWSAIAAAMISSPSTLDVVVRGGARYRVKLRKSCQASDFYSDFYVKATPDGQICQSRDSIYSRAGGECSIDKFRALIRSK